MSYNVNDLQKYIGKIQQNSLQKSNLQATVSHMFKPDVISVSQATATTYRLPLVTAATQQGLKIDITSSGTSKITFTMNKLAGETDNECVKRLINTMGVNSETPGTEGLLTFQMFQPSGSGTIEIASDCTSVTGVPLVIATTGDMGILKLNAYCTLTPGGEMIALSVAHVNWMDRTAPP